MPNGGVSEESPVETSPGRYGRETFRATGATSPSSRLRTRGQRKGTAGLCRTPRMGVETRDVLYLPRCAPEVHAVSEASERNEVAAGTGLVGCRPGVTSEVEGREGLKARGCAVC